MRPTVSLLAIALSAVALTGCSTAGRPSVRGSDAPSSSTELTYEQPIAASALVFDAPVADEPQPFLSRSDRQPGAFFGYDEGSIEYYSLTVDDRQLGLGGGTWGGSGGRGCGSGFGGGSGWYDRYDRRAYSERVGSIRR